MKIKDHLEVVKFMLNIFTFTIHFLSLHTKIAAVLL